MKYVEAKNHELRYTLKDTSTGQVYLAVVFSVVLPEDQAERDNEGSHDEDDGNLGKFEWEAQPSASDVE
jgi:hypothetical protein